MTSKGTYGEFWRVIRFLDDNRIGFTRSARAFPYDKETIYASGHAMRALSERYVDEQDRKAA